MGVEINVKNVQRGFLFDQLQRWVRKPSSHQSICGRRGCSLDLRHTCTPSFSFLHEHIVQALAGFVRLQIQVLLNVQAKVMII